MSIPVSIYAYTLTGFCPQTGQTQQCSHCWMLKYTSAGHLCFSHSMNVYLDWEQNNPLMTSAEDFIFIIIFNVIILDSFMHTCDST